MNVTVAKEPASTDMPRIEWKRKVEEGGERKEKGKQKADKKRFPVFHASTTPIFDARTAETPKNSGIDG